MNTQTIAFVLATAATFAVMPGCANDPFTQANAATASASQIAWDAHDALDSLYIQSPTARAMGRKAKAVLVFPTVVKGGIVVAAEIGNGALIRNNGKIGGYYQTTAASCGLLAGLQEFGYALFLMDNHALRNLNRRDGWDIGSSPDLVVVDQGRANSLTATALDQSTYAFFFDPYGLVGGLGVQGCRIIRIHPEE